MGEIRSKRCEGRELTRINWRSNGLCKAQAVRGWSYPSLCRFARPRRNLRRRALPRYRGRPERRRVHCTRHRAPPQSRQSCRAGPRPSCGRSRGLRWFRSTRQSHRRCIAPQPPNRSAEDHDDVNTACSSLHLKTDVAAVALTSPIQAVPAPAVLKRCSICRCSAALVTVARCPPGCSRAQLSSASYHVAGVA